ncbi:MAG: PEP-CTERM sorting domain-containing protein [Candidatus Solibacter sp.]|nr:PEP-CTERM sorting domain-containing protein [Candidatus Solibacter sp.]
MTRFPARVALSVCVLLLACSLPAWADALSYQFSGAVNSSEAAGIPIGAELSITFLYDNAAPTTGGGPNYGDYRSTLSQFHADLPGASFQTGSTLDMRTAHGVGFTGWPGVSDEYYDFLRLTGVDVTRHLVVLLYLLDADQSVFASSRDLPATLPLAEFEAIYFVGYELEGGSGKRITGLLTPVPEPSGLLLLLTVATLAGASIRRLSRIR